MQPHANACFCFLSCFCKVKDLENFSNQPPMIAQPACIISIVFLGIRPPPTHLQSLKHYTAVFLDRLPPAPLTMDRKGSACNCTNLFQVVVTVVFTAADLRCCCGKVVGLPHCAGASVRMRCFSVSRGRTDSSQCTTTSLQGRCECGMDHFGAKSSFIYKYI